jgi:hypothetical protein
MATAIAAATARTLEIFGVFISRFVFPRFSGRFLSRHWLSRRTPPTGFGQGAIPMVLSRTFGHTCRADPAKPLEIAGEFVFSLVKPAHIPAPLG